MGYIGYHKDWPKVSQYDFVGDPNGQYIEHIECYFDNLFEQQFNFLCFGNKYMQQECNGKTYQTDKVQFIVYCKPGQKLTADSFGSKSYPFDNAEFVAKWANTCVGNWFHKNEL